MASTDDKTMKEQWAAVPGWFKVILGVAGLLVSWKLFPIVELLNLFALIVLVPLCLLGSVGLIADGASVSMRNAWNVTMERARDEAAKLA
jgi:hypothetical protein